MARILTGTSTVLKDVFVVFSPSSSIPGSHPDLDNIRVLPHSFQYTIDCHPLIQP